MEPFPPPYMEGVEKYHLRQRENVIFVGVQKHNCTTQEKSHSG